MVPAITIPASINGFVFGVFCLIFAARRGPIWVSIMFTGAVFGFLLEYSAVKTPHTYFYCKFWFMLLDVVPAMIVVSWGGLIYSVMRTSNSLRLKWWLRPAYEGMLAMGIDISLDPIAISLGYWTYEMKDPSEWFGVPFGNYLGWFGMVFWFSLSLRTLARVTNLATRSRLWHVLLPPVAAVIAFVPFALMMTGYKNFIMDRTIEPYAFAVFFMTILTILVRYLPSLPHDAPIDPAAIAAPLFFGVFQNLIIFAAPVFGAKSPLAVQPSLAILTPIATLFVLICFCWPFLDTIRDGMAPKFSIVEEVSQLDGTTIGHSHPLQV